MDDVYEELEACYNEIMEKNISAIGETLYTEHFFFCNTSDIVDKKTQLRIKEYNYSKSFSSPPYPSINQTPARIVDEFMMIDNEINCLRKRERNVAK